MGKWLTSYFAAQNVNKELAVNLDWLAAQHIDEVISVSPKGKLIVADPESAWALLLWANKIDRNAPLFDGMAPFFFGDTVGGVVDVSGIQGINFTGPNAIMAKKNLPSVRAAVEKALDTKGPTSMPVGDQNNKSNASLDKGGALVGFFTNKNVWEYELRFNNVKNDQEYELWYKDGPQGQLRQDGTGNIADDSVFTKANAFILKHWWQGKPKAGDVFRFTANPNATTVEMPVLFRSDGKYYSTNHVNSFIDDGTAITGRTFGPVVNYKGTGNRDILGDYVKAQFQSAGLTALMVDARFYHNGCASIHCGMNVKRDIPNYNWWGP